MEAVPVALSYAPTMAFYPLLLLTVVLIVLYIYVETRRTVKLGNKLPGPPTIPLLGNILTTIGIEPHQVVEKLLQYDVYGNVVRAFLGPKLYVFLMDPRDIEIILSSHEHIDKSSDYRFFKPWLGDGLLISTGKKWYNHRKIIAPTFHQSVLKTFVPLFYENSRDLVLKLRDKVGKEFDCHDYLSTVTVDILLETAMGVKGTQKEKTSFDYAMAVMKMCNIIHQRQYRVLLRFDHTFKFTNFAKQQEKLLGVIHGLTTRVIHKRKQEYYNKNIRECMDKIRSMDTSIRATKEDTTTTTTTTTTEQSYTQMHYVKDDLDEIDENDVGEKKRLAFLDLLLELARSGVKLTDEEIKEEVDTIMFEGHDTTAAASSFVLCVLGIHQDFQDRVYEELNDIFKDSDRPCTFQDTLQMKYLERVILETLRLFPPVPAIARQLNVDVRLVTNNYLLPKGSTVIIPQFKVHRLEEYYPNANVFNPDNFLPERMQERHYYSFIPFSAGPRSCVGRKYAMLKLKVLLSTILRNYRITSDRTEDEFRLQVDIILKRSDGFNIKIEPREKSTCSNIRV